jgi:hypothetical protein
MLSSISCDVFLLELQATVVNSASNRVRYDIKTIFIIICGNI